MSEAKPAEFKAPGEYRYDGDGNTYCDIFPSDILDHIKNNFKLRDDDVMVITYPKAGTTWYQEMVWLIMNEADAETAIKVNQRYRVPFLEIVGSQAGAGKQNTIETLEATESPRIMKSHLAHCFFSEELKKKKTKVVFGVRNVKDSIVSYYHFYRMNAHLGNFTGTFNEFFEQLVCDGRLVHGDWFDHTLGYWNHRSEFNFYLLKYEDAKKDLKLTLRKLAEFLGKSLTDEQFESIAQHVSFDKMKSNASVNKDNNPSVMNHKISPFMRKGQVGDWKNYFTDEQNEYINLLYKQKIIPTGLDFDFDL